VTVQNDIPFEQLPGFRPGNLENASRDLYKFMNRRRSIRSFSGEPISDEVLKNCILAAGTAPSGANQQPWTFVLVKNPAVRRRIREEAERVEYDFYTGKSHGEWKSVLEPLGTDYKKPFLENAPCLIVIFTQKYTVAGDGAIVKHYYAGQSVGIATGFLISALHRLGISTLTYTPGKMGFLNGILERPKNEQPYLILVVGYAAPGTRIPDIERKSFKDIAVIV
jgi:nitroreductase